MNLKKLALCFGLTCMFSIIGCNSEIFAKSAENTDSTSLNESGITQKISCGKVFDDEILCIEDLKCGEEETLKNSSDEDLPYRKFLEYKREYRKYDIKNPISLEKYTMLEPIYYVLILKYG